MVIKYLLLEYSKRDKNDDMEKELKKREGLIQKLYKLLKEKNLITGFVHQLQKCSIHIALKSVRQLFQMFYDM